MEHFLSFYEHSSPNPSKAAPARTKTSRQTLPTILPSVLFVVQMSSASNFRSKWGAVVYANNAPPPSARIVADLQLDVATRFSVPVDAVLATDPDGV